MSELPEINIDLDRPGTFNLLVRVERARTLADQAEIVREIIETFSDVADVDAAMSRLSVKDIQRIYESLARAVEEMRQSPLS